ncbi:MAG: hypothetical protein HZC49_03720 [Nitrospirae bacterium]|nr:hypothetical protein [Nitrospirota bacterium]
MKKILAGIVVLLIISAGVLAFAHGPGRWGGHMTGPGYGGRMMMEPGGPVTGPDQAFLNETAELRKELHNKKFEYFEAKRDPKTTVETLSRLEKEIYDIRSSIREKAPRTMNKNLIGYGRCR